MAAASSRRRWAGWVALGVSLVVIYRRFAGHVPGLFPEVDWIRPRGMELWPGLGNAVGMLLLVAALGAMARGASPWLRRLTGVGAVLVVAYWVFPQHFMVDRLSPSSVGSDTIPVVIDGVYAHRRWDRQGEPGVPIGQLGATLANEARLSAMAHGIGHSAALQHPDRQGGAATSVPGRARSTLWAVQRGLGPVLALLGLGVAVFSLGCLVQIGRRRPMPAPGRGAALVMVVLLVPPLANLLMRAVGWATGMPEAATGAPRMLVHSGMTIGAVVLAHSAACLWRADCRGEE